MKPLVKLLSIIALLGAFAVQSQVANAQATRTWVSGVGDDVNPCSRTAPCKTFAGAISKTAASGIINCLDPGGFGAVTITKSITIDCSGTFGGVLATGTNGINVIVGASDVVTLRGISIEGGGTGFIGVNHTSAGTLHIENCRIYGFDGGSANGIRFAPNGTASLFVADTVVSENGLSGVGAGIVVRPTGSGATRVNLRRVQSFNNAQGIVSDSSGGSNVIFIHAVDTSVTSNIGAGFSIVAGVFNSVYLDRTSSSQNGGTGVLVNGSSAQVLLANSTIMSNNVGVSLINGATGYSYLTSQISANGSDGNVPLPNALSQY